MFVDDSDVNVTRSSELGMQAIEFDSPDQLRRELQAAGLLDGVSPPLPNP